jgi:serine/threonine-protein kinase HipA
VLVVHRFDANENGKPFRALEDFCALLGLRPEHKYETTWERIAKAVRDHVDGRYQHETFQKLAAILLMTYAMSNSDCHSKNLALLYTSREDARLAPVYDFFTTSIYTGYRDNAPGIMFGGRKTWLPGKTLAKFITATFNIAGREQKEMVERISDAVVDTAPAVREMMSLHAGFRDTGKRMLATWNDGVNQLRDSRMYSLSTWKSSSAFKGISDPPKLENPKTVIVRSELLAVPGTGSSSYNHRMKTEEILSLIDTEISKLKQARSLLAGVAPVKVPATTKETKVTAKAPDKRKKMSAETKAKMAAAQRARWAAQKKS